MTAYHKEVIKDYKNGMPIRDIGEKYEITKANIYIILKGNDVELRKGKVKKSEKTDWF
jgi:Mor family transcriptional regulator